MKFLAMEFWFRMGLGGLLTFSLCFAGCGDPKGIVLVPSPDAAWNTERQVAVRLSKIQLLLDGAGGFDASHTVDGAELVDADGDGELEVLLTMDVAGRSDLPWIRIEPGQAPERPLSVRLRGLDGESRVLAYGGIEAQPLFAGHDRLNIPFDLSRSALAPFVTAVSPGGAPSGSSLAALAFFASKPLDSGSMEGRAHVSLDGVGELAGSWNVRDGCPDGAQMWVFHPSGCWPASGASMALHLQLDQGVLDLDGQVLVDDEGQAGFSANLNLAILEFGACQPVVECSALEPASHRVDLRCDTGSGLLEPADCSNASGSCLGLRSLFGVVAGEDTAACEAYRSGAVAVEGACVIMDAWPCLRQSDCRGFGTFVCDSGPGLCVPDACLGTCPVTGQICVPDWGCQPGLGACLESCAAYGSCAEFTQTCALRADGLWSCR